MHFVISKEFIKEFLYVTSKSSKAIKSIMGSNIKSVGLLTSGGDAPGMNAAIRAVTRAGIFNNMKVHGIYRGYRGLISEDRKSVV